MSKKITDNRKAKQVVVKEINKQITDSSSMVVAEYHGLTVSNMQDLRNKLKEKDVIMKVYKNRLLNIALKGTGYEDLGKGLVGPNVFIFGTTDEIAPAKIVAEFAKEHSALKLKAGVYEGKVINAEEVMQVATLPSYEEALTMLAGSMMAPLRYASVGMNMLVEDGKIKGE